MRVAAEPAAVGSRHPAELGGIGEADVGERELKALSFALAHDGQASP